jgi:hypothetical protein
MNLNPPNFNKLQPENILKLPFSTMAGESCTEMIVIDDMDDSGSGAGPAEPTESWRHTAVAHRTRTGTDEDYSIRCSGCILGECLCVTLTLSLWLRVAPVVGSSCRAPMPRCQDAKSRPLLVPRTHTATAMAFFPPSPSHCTTLCQSFARVHSMPEGAGHCCMGAAARLDSVARSLGMCTRPGSGVMVCELTRVNPPPSLPHTQPR